MVAGPMIQMKDDMVYCSCEQGREDHPFIESAKWPDPYLWHDLSDEISEHDVCRELDNGSLGTALHGLSCD
jgi:hypothetical protein